MDEKNNMLESDHVEKTNSPSTDREYVPNVEEEQKLLHKLDRTILPWIMLIYLLSYLDRSNLGNARNIGLAKDIGLDNTTYELAAAAFYISLCLFGTIGGLMLKVVKPSTWLGICAMGWGAMSALQSACTTPAGLIVVRFFLGVFEASFGPGCALYLSFWYLKSELSLRIAAYSGMSALSGLFAGLISYGLGEAQHMVVKSWQALFIVEGVPTFVVGLITIWILPGRPESKKTHGFTEEEQKIILSRRTRFTKNDDCGINLQQVKEALLDYRLYLFTLMMAGINLSLAVSSVFLPTIVKDLGYESVKANLMTAPIYATAYISVLVISWMSDRFRRRGFFLAFAGATAGVGYILLAVLRNDEARYAMCFLTVAGTNIANPIFLAWVSSTFAGDTKAGVGMGISIAVTHSLSVAASTIYPTGDAPYYLMGNAVASAFTFTTAVTAAAMSILLWKENKRRDRKYGRPEVGISIDMGGAADKVPDYRYET